MVCAIRDVFFHYNQFSVKMGIFFVEMPAYLLYQYDFSLNTKY